MMPIHWLRPWALVALIPLFVLVIFLWRQNPRLQSWSAICDAHLLRHVVKNKGNKKHRYVLICLALSAVFMILGWAGPCWTKLAMPTYRKIIPRIAVLNMSESMQNKDVSPDRLTRAKFVLHDLFTQPDPGPFGLVVYTAEPFVVSPLTDDAKTIDALLGMLSVDIMPVEGNQLEAALQEAAKLIRQAGYYQGQILVMTSNQPSGAAIQMAKTLAKQQIDTSIMPIVLNSELEPLYQPLAEAGNGMLLSLSKSQASIANWLKLGNKAKQLALDKQYDIPQWRDVGRWFILPALLFLLPAFRRGWLTRFDA